MTPVLRGSCEPGGGGGMSKNVLHLLESTKEEIINCIQVLRA